MSRLSIMARARLALSIAPLTEATRAAKAAWADVNREVTRIQGELNALPEAPDWTSDDFENADGYDWTAVVAEGDRLAAVRDAATSAAKAAAAALSVAERAEAEARTALARGGGWPTGGDAAFELREPSPFSGAREPADVATLQRLTALPERSVSDW